MPPLPLWHIQGNDLFATTWSLWEWTVYYYNPVGSYQVWEDYWLYPGLPTAAIIFWSVAARIILAAALILWQNRQEEEGKEFSIKDIILLANLRSRIRKHKASS